METQNMLRSVLSDIKGNFPTEKHGWIREYIEVGEFGVALEVLVELINEYKIPISTEGRNLLIHCGDQMRIDVAHLLQE
ncbi:MafI family immunity protein [Paraburkholderia bannensis]|uniref:MafI family immunity protein n=1 Tax=Paraburkholderia bannensis TaxID=765414 RepID=UPI002AB030A0|nr:MafI family immunity protein [Paraburkholderia bannensis]